MGYENEYCGKQSLSVAALRGWRYAAFLLFELSQQRNAKKVMELVPKDKVVDNGVSDPRPKKELLRSPISDDDKEENGSIKLA
jgi:hypothetical protein